MHVGGLLIVESIGSITILINLALSSSTTNISSSATCGRIGAHTAAISYGPSVLLSIDRLRIGPLVRAVIACLSGASGRQVCPFGRRGLLSYVLIRMSHGLGSRPID